MKKFLSNEKNHKFLIPMISIFLGFLLGVIILLLTKTDVSILFKSILRATLGINIDNFGKKGFFSPRFVGEYFVYCMPIILTGISVSFAFKTGMFNIGAEGQLLMGSLGACVVGILFDFPKIILLPFAILAGILFGAIWGYIAGFLKAKFNVHEVVVTIMLNYIALRLSNYIYKILPGSSTYKTVTINKNALLSSEFLSNITGNSRFHWGFILVIVALFIYSFIINKTVLGYELKAVGYNPFASFYAGIDVKRKAALSMGIAGAFSGLAGVIITIGTFSNGRILSAFENYGYDGIAVALIGSNTAVGSLFSGMLLGALKAAQPIMQSQGVPNSIAIIISSSIIFFIAMNKKIKEILIKIGGDK